MSFPTAHPPQFQPEPFLLAAAVPGWGLAPQGPHGSRDTHRPSTMKLSWEQPSP